MSKGTDLCEARQVHDSQVQDVRAVYPQRYRKLADTLVLARNTERLLLYLSANVIEVGKALVYVQKLAPLGVWRRV